MTFLLSEKEILLNALSAILLFQIIASLLFLLPFHQSALYLR